MKRLVDRDGVGAEHAGGTGEELANVLDAAVDVSADVVWIVLLHRCRRPSASLEDPFAEPRRETLHLCLDPVSHVEVDPLGTWQ